MYAKLAIGLAALLMTTALAEAREAESSGDTLHQFSFCGYDKGSDTFYCGNKAMIVGQGLIPVDPPLDVGSANASGGTDDKPAASGRTGDKPDSAPNH
jgi:hypothetical protein